jgi:predicted metal-dependent hydrolase
MARIEPDEPSYDPAQWGANSGAEHLARGIELFNEGRYLAAHEEFERVWLSTHGQESDFLKGLIQAAIAMHHFEKGNLDGAAQLYRGHRRYLAAYLPTHDGIDVAAFLTAMQRTLQPVLRRTPGTSIHFDSTARPAIRPAKN